MPDQAEATEKVVNREDPPDGEPNSVSVSEAAIQREIDKNPPKGDQPSTTEANDNR